MTRILTLSAALFAFLALGLAEPAQAGGIKVGIRVGHGHGHGHRHVHVHRHGRWVWKTKRVWVAPVLIGYDAHGVAVTEETMAAAHAADAVIFGAVGGPKWDAVPYDVRPEAMAELVGEASADDVAAAAAAATPTGVSILKRLFPEYF